jgi:hypothetical protein
VSWRGRAPNESGVHVTVNMGLDNGQHATRRIKASRAWTRGSVRGKRAHRLEGRACGSDGRPPDSVGDQLFGPSDGPIDPSR